MNICEGVTTCDRCHRPTYDTTMSMFNTDIICPDCKDVERNHPQYALAVEAERQQIQAGNYHFSGIGRPSDL